MKLPGILSSGRAMVIGVPALLVLLLAGCAPVAISPEAANPQLPESWQQSPRAEKTKANWLAEFDDPALEAYVDQAMAGNYRLAQQRAQVADARAQVVVSGADRFPDLALGLDGARGRSQGESPVSESYDLSLATRWELDIWGKLNARQQQAVYSLAASEADLDGDTLTLAADTAIAWYNLVAAGQLQELFRQRLLSIHSTLQIIERGYRQGINEALDVYLTRNTLEQEKANVAAQEQARIEAAASLQLLLADYPAGDLKTAKQLPMLDEPVAPGLPSEIIGRRPDVRAAWLRLLAADATLAAAHKDRFPSLVLTASTGDSSIALHNLVDGGNLAWRAAASLTQPLFQAGRLQALEKQALQRVIQAENAYLDTLFQALAEVETSLSNQRSLQQRYQAFLAAEQNANAAFKLSFQQYQRGLVSYTTVLEAQRRAFDAETTVVSLRNQLLQNRIRLHLALGGTYGAPGQVQ